MSTAPIILPLEDKFLTKKSQVDSRESGKNLWPGK